jgi:hypothetical protein
MQAKEKELAVDLVRDSGKSSPRSNSSNQDRGINPQVKAVRQRAARRKFSSADKSKIIREFEACSDASERGVFLRKNGLYYSSITKWKRELSGKNASHATPKAHKTMLANNQLKAENARLKKQLTQAEAIIEIQKKVSELLSMSVLDQNVNEIES